MSGVICRITLLPIVLICFRGRLCFLVKRDEVRSPFAMDAVREFIADVSPPPSSEAADACACDINYRFCNVAFASICGINSLSLSLERNSREGAAYFIYGLGCGITCPDHGAGSEGVSPLCSPFKSGLCLMPNARVSPYF